jgi:hypothetical protein
MIFRGMFPVQEYPDLSSETELTITAKQFLDKLNLAYDMGYGEGLSKGSPDKAFSIYVENK